MIQRILNSLQARYSLMMKKAMGEKSEIPCNICGNNKFIKGPNNRLSLTGKQPWCPNCWSLERHRGLRVFWERFDSSYLKDLEVLQFSHDPAVKIEWFKSHMISQWGAENSLDVQNIDKPDGTYDLVLCNQVIEHVKDDRSAIKELLRITTKDGFVELGVPYPMERKDTIDWGKPNPADHDHYRNYGSEDIKILLDELVGKGCWKDIIITDPSTKAQDYVYVLCHSKEALANVLSQIKN